MHSQLRLQTLDFARVRTFYRRDWSWIASVGMKRWEEQSPAGP